MPENKQQKNIHRVKGLLQLWADTLVKQKADESLDIMCVYEFRHEHGIPVSHAR